MVAKATAEGYYDDYRQDSPARARKIFSVAWSRILGMDMECSYSLYTQWGYTKNNTLG